jgi:hypothetical protein
MCHPLLISSQGFTYSPESLALDDFCVPSSLPDLVRLLLSFPSPPFPFVLFLLGDNGHSPFRIISQRGEERI